MTAVKTSKESRFKFRHIPSLIKETAINWTKDDPWRMSAVVAYFALLSLPGLLVIVFTILNFFWKGEIVEGEIYGQIESALGSSAAETIESVFVTASENQTSWFSAIISIGALVFGATGVFFHLQISINRVWNLQSDPKNGFVKYLIDRSKSFGFVLIIGFLLLISFVVSALLNSLEGYFSKWLPDVAFHSLLIGEIVISLGVVTVLFALMFKYLPDVLIGWRSVWVGALITAILFSLGKELLSFYFGFLSPGDVYGAAGSVIIILLWVTYSSLILFFGAEFTKVYTQRYGYKMIPKSHAVFTDQEDKL
ncbi:YihY/virulence factor BrkB family protein [Natronoflexus pectinivorans]|uniref:Membrane protein n=1 Tax=Natronoflexus pectinivorans TaxID=682526 RepID=A0A4R2GSA7_9BACT|nr:YihY/virulence factor BrkB family protein [Natronoflexus pectinivorans]TCO11086.1 membrane protein [Natronoflexus pectinivorans]